MIDRRTLLRGMAATGALAGLTGCMGQPSSSHKGADAVPVSWVRYRIGSFVSIDPLHVADEAGRVAVSQLFDPLLRFDYATKTLAPCAAVSYVVAPDARSVTFKLTADATFHNGEAVTSAAFKRAWERLVRPLATDADGEPIEADTDEAGDADDVEVPHSPSARLLALVEGFDALYRGAASELAGLRCPDDQTLEVHLTKPCAEWAYLAAAPALAPVPQAATEDPASFAARPIGNGPFKMKQALKNKREIRLTACKDYVGGEPSVEGVLLAAEGDTEAAYKRFRTGDVDVCDVPVGQYRDAQDTAGISEDGCTMSPGAGVIHSDEPALLALRCNTRVAALAGVAVRTAVSHAVDRETLAEKTLKYSAVPASGLVPPCVGDAPAWAACPYDPERAEELLQGVYPADESGARKLAFTLLYRTGGVQARVAEQIKGELAAVGVTVRLKEAEADEFAELCAAGDYECALISWAPARPTPLAFAEVLTEGGAVAALATGEGAQVTSEGEPVAVATLLEEACATVDAAKRDELCTQALQLASEELSVIPLAYPAHTEVASEHIEHLTIAPDAIPDLAHARK